MNTKEVLTAIEKLADKLGKKNGPKGRKRFFFISDSPIKVTKIPEPPKDIIGNYHKTP